MTTAQERKKQERQARRRRIQSAARTVFAAKGYAKTSIEQIAREASLSVGAIYLYFRSKEDLYISLLEEPLEYFDSELSAIRNKPEYSVAQKLQAAWQFLTSWATNDVEATRVLRLTSQPDIRKQLSDEVAKRINEGLSGVRQHFTAIVEEGVAAGVYQNGKGAETVDLLWSLFLGVLQSNDARINLDLPGGGLNDLAQNAFLAIDGNLRSSAQPTALA